MNNKLLLLKGRGSLFFLFFACLVPFAIFILPILGYKDFVYKLDSYSPFWVFSLQLGIGLLLFAKLSKDFYLWLKELIPYPLSLIPVFLIVGFALAVSIAFIEPRSRVQADESIHYVIAQNLYYNQIGQLCIQGLFMEDGMACVMGGTVKTRGLSYIYMLGMPFFGTDLYWVHNLHLFFLVLALISFYLALVAWLPVAGRGSHGELPLLAVALLATCPILLFCFRSASVEPIYVTMFGVSLLFLKWAYDRDTTRHWLLLALTLAFFAQTRSETVFCLFAFIGVVLYRKKFRVLDFQFGAFLSTLSFFSLPVLCTLSYNRDSDLQGGTYGAHGHLFGNIVADFKIMALPHTSDDGTLVYPFLPYFTWLAIFGLITLIVLTIKEIRSKKSTPYKYISAFILILSPQYLILFDGVSADLNLGIQQRFTLVILPVMAFLGALFLCGAGTVLKKIRLFNNVNPIIPKIGVIAIILSTCLLEYKTFIKDIPNINNFVAIEEYEVNKWIREKEQKRILLFYWHPLLTLAHGHSTYSYNNLLDLNSKDLNEILEDYNGEVYFINPSTCDITVGHPKMQASNTFRYCDRAIRYFNTEEVFSTKILEHFNPLSIHKILGFNALDTLGLLRILNKVEPTDTTVHLHFKVPKELSKPWKVQHFVNDSLFFDSPYIKDIYIDTYPLSAFNKDTNTWKLTIVDTITGEQVHSDFWELVRVRK
ncbi:MAG: hypothetical protein LBC87_02605 [Fibromonadaceae bacterium]|jgi:hypothetical protein|nr:hypothetical protein [Fibromonadaceae bacterium]